MPKPHVLSRRFSTRVGRLCASALCTLLLSVLCIVGAHASGAVSPLPTRLDPGLVEQINAAPESQHRILIRMEDRADLSAAARIEDWSARGWAVYRSLRRTADLSQTELLSRASLARAQGKAADLKSYWIVNLVSMTADRQTILELAELPGVQSIQPELKLEIPRPDPEPSVRAPLAIEWGINKIRAPEVWSVYGTTGAGVVLANVDTGVQFNHPALVGQYRGNLGGGNFDHNYNWFDPAFGTAFPNDSNGHGTHTMGTSVGGDGGSNQIGVAPGAKWISAFGCCPSNEALLEAQQFMLAPTDLTGNNPDPDLRPQVLNQSWGGPGGSEIFEEVIAALRASGIFPAFSAGNNGASTAVTGCGRLGSPGDNPSAFNVGNTDINDLIASSSSRGPNPVTGKVGPEVSAPGSNVRSSVPGNGYSNFSGTSMASPHVAGAVGLLIAVEPRLKGRIDELEELLRKTAAPLTSTQACGGVAGSQIPNNVFGWGRIDVKAAADMVFDAGYIEGNVTVAGILTAGVVVSYTRLGKSLTTSSDASGRYRIVAGAGTWAMQAAFQGQTLSAPAVAVVADVATTQDFALSAISSFALSGTVTEVGTGAPIRALLMIADDRNQAPVWSDAITGAYSLNVPAGTWSLTATHPGYQPLSQSVSVGGVVNLQMTPRQNYSCLDSTEVGGPIYSWADATDGTAFPLDDDASSGAQTLPGTFNYFGNPFTSVRINSNGFLFFGTTVYTTANMYLPFEGRPNNDVMALGEDLNPALGAQGNIYGKTVGTQYVVQYHQVQHWASGFPETFQIILDTATGQITYQYHTLSNPDFTTVGVEDSLGAVGQLYSFRNSANLQPGTAVRFTPATGNLVNWGCDHALTLTQSDSVDPVALGQEVTYTLHWNLTGFGGAPQANLTATVPANSSFVAASGGVTPVAGVLTWPLGDQRPRASGTAWFTVNAESIPQMSTSATISDASNETRSATQTTAVVIIDSIFNNGFE